MYDYYVIIYDIISNIMYDTISCKANLAKAHEFLYFAASERDCVRKLQC
jgi:hypothetical protein